MLIEKAYAKLNLILEVKGKRSDGYHDLNMINVPLDFYDTLHFELNDELMLEEEIKIENNLIIKTAQYIKEKYNVKSGAKIKLEKKIPIGSGLGGGSANIAATIRGLDKLWELNLDNKDKEEIALRFGSDTLFCLYNKPAYVFGRGEQIEFLDNIIFDNIFLLPSIIEVSTKKVFENYIKKQGDANFDYILNKYKNKEAKEFIKNIKNDLTETTLNLYPQLRKTIKKLNKDIHMTGSGSTFFLIVSDNDEEKIIKKLIKKRLDYIKTSVKS